MVVPVTLKSPAILVLPEIIWLPVVVAVPATVKSPPMSVFPEILALELAYKAPCAQIGMVEVGVSIVKPKLSEKVQLLMLVLVDTWSPFQ